jgi:hypothetical protein
VPPPRPSPQAGEGAQHSVRGVRSIAAALEVRLLIIPAGQTSNRAAGAVPGVFTAGMAWRAGIGIRCGASLASPLAKHFVWALLGAEAV